MWRQTLPNTQQQHTNILELPFHINMHTHPTKSSISLPNNNLAVEQKQQTLFSSFPGLKHHTAYFPLSKLRRESEEQNSKT